jgi:hypothetical protein
MRAVRRGIYLKLLRDLAREFDRIYTDRLVALNGPWDFKDVYIASEQSRKCLRRMRWCAFRHLLHLPGVTARSAKLYEKMRELFIPVADLKTF